MEIYTIGFTKKSAPEFFDSLKKAGIGRLVDVRLSNKSQMAGFPRRQDLPYFLAEICDAVYVHEPLLAPTAEMLKAYRAGAIDWHTYTNRFLELIAKRRVEVAVDWARLLDRPAVLLCSEAEPRQCHRRLVIEYLNRQGWELTPIHL